MAIPKINMIGCGKLGKTIASLLSAHHLAQIQDVYTTSLDSAEAAVGFIGQGTACAKMSEIRAADLYFFCTPDDEIETSQIALLKAVQPSPNSAFVHFSGALTSQIFKAAIAAGCKVASLHPIKSFANPQESIQTFTGTFCAFEGDMAVYNVLEPLFIALGAQVFFINPDKKALYHAGSVFACNYLVTLAYIAKTCFEKTNIAPEIAKAMVDDLMQNTLDNIYQSEKMGDAMTGPIERGDIQTILKHIEALKEVTQYADLYRLLGMKTLDLIQQQPDKISKLTDIFNTGKDRH